MSTLHVAIPQEQESLLNQLASREGQSVDMLVEELLREGIERRRHAQSTAERLQALTRIEEHRQTFLARHNQRPLDIDPAGLLQQAREERSEYLLSVLEEHSYDRG